MVLLQRVQSYLEILFLWVRASRRRSSFGGGDAGTVSKRHASRSHVNHGAHGGPLLRLCLLGHARPQPDRRPHLQRHATDQCDDTQPLVLHHQADWRAVLPWIVAALVLYAASLLITISFNVPLNNELNAAGDPDHIADLAAVRERFEASWVRWNIARAVASTAAFGCLIWALVLHGRAL